MAIAGKGSRPITVDEVGYRWTVSEDSGYKVVVVQHQSGSGPRLEVRTPYGPTWAAVAIGPGIVARLIRMAITDGWRPTAEDTAETDGRR